MAKFARVLVSTFIIGFVVACVVAETPKVRDTMYNFLEYVFVEK